MNHNYDYQKIDSPIESFLLDHIIKFLRSDTKVELQHPIKTISGNFKADLTLMNKEKIIMIECDGKEHHTKEIDDWYDEWRDALILVQRKADTIYRIKGKDIFYNMNAILKMIGTYEPDIFNDSIDRLPEIEFWGEWYKKYSTVVLAEDDGEEIEYSIEIKRKDLQNDFDSFWLKYVIFSLLYPNKNVYQLIEIFKSKHYEIKDLIRQLNDRYPHLKLQDERSLINMKFKPI